MIDNIKTFVNNHQALIVVVIGVLAICFLYWCLCCKDKPLVNKVKGGNGLNKIVCLKMAPPPNSVMHG